MEAINILITTQNGRFTKLCSSLNFTNPRH